MRHDKLDALVHYICASCDNPSTLGVTRLNQVLWYSDVFAFAEFGESITASKYIKRRSGPVAKEMIASRSRLRAAGKILERVASALEPREILFFSLESPDISMFSAEQISLVDNIVEAICSNHTAVSPIHDFIWQSAEIGEEIPMAAAAFGGNLGNVDEADMEWANDEIDIIERVIAAA